jgi:hypothetical protein
VTAVVVQMTCNLLLLRREFRRRLAFTELPAAPATATAG